MSEVFPARVCGLAREYNDRAMKLVLTSVLFLFVFTAEAVACSCARPPQPCEAYGDAAAIFVGTVTFSTRTRIKEGDYESTKRLVRFHDAQAVPAADVLMELIPAAGEPNAFSSYVRTDKEGRYVMKLVRPGRYYLGVRIAGSAGATYVPYPQTYFPGVKDRSQANVITIAEGQRIELEELILPPRFIHRTLSGIVVDEDGKPVAGATVWLKERQYEDADMPYRRETDSEGKFSYPVYDGIKYSLNAYLESGGRHVKRSDPVEVVITSNQEPIKIVVTKEK